MRFFQLQPMFLPALRAVDHRLIPRHPRCIKISNAPILLATNVDALEMRETLMTEINKGYGHIKAVTFGIRAFHLRRLFQTVGFGEFFGLGSRFIAGAGCMTQQVLARSTRLSSPVPQGTELQNIDCGVDVPVMPGSAFRTGPFSNPQWHFVLNNAAFRTGLAGGRKAVNHFNRAPIPRRFVFDLSAKFAHADIGDCTRQGVILDHALDMQIFQYDHVGALDDGGCGLV